MTYRITEDMLRELRTNVGVHGDANVIAESSDGPPLRTSLDEISMFGDNAIEGVQFNKKSFAIFLAMAGFNSNAFRQTSDFAADTYTFGAVKPSELDEFAAWLRLHEKINKVEDVTEKPEVLCKLRFAWYGLIWRMEEQGLLGPEEPEEEVFLRPDLGLSIFRQMYYNKALSMTEVDGSPLNEDFEGGGPDNGETGV